MSNHDPRSNAISRRDQALAEANRWEKFLAMLDELEGAVAPSQPQSPARPITPNPPAQTGILDATERAAIQIITKAGRPVPTRDLLVGLDELGIRIGGKEPLSTLSARLSRATGLENVRPYGWQLRSQAASIDEAAGSLFTEEPAASDPNPNDADAARGGGT
jgi:hypothetical protein